MAPRTKGSKARTGIPSNTNANNTPQSPLSWPPITSVLSADDLELHPLLPQQILTISQLWTAGLCKAYTNFLASLPLVTTPGKPKRGEAVRVNDRFQIDDPKFAASLWSETALQSLVANVVIDGLILSPDEKRELWGGDVLGLNPNIRIYRYSKGQFFDQHYDESNNVMFPSKDDPNAVSAKTTWTLLLYLTSTATGCKGGQTVFYPDPPGKRQAAPAPIVAELEVGMALLHRHGKDCMIHEGREVTEGEKWVIRSDLCVRR